MLRQMTTETYKLLLMRIMRSMVTAKGCAAEVLAQRIERAIKLIPGGTTACFDGGAEAEDT